MGANMRKGFLLILLMAGLATPAWTLASARNLLKRPESWYTTEEAKKAAASVLSFQSPLGGWPKNVDTTTQPYVGSPERISPTFDNNATTDELRFLARMYDANQDAKYKEAFSRGVEYILKAQYPTGGWPQFYPPSTQYHRHITFNDDAMVRLMEFLREVYSSPRYGFVDADTKARAKAAFDHGIECILKCQIRVNGKATVWCAQHDEKDYAPRPGRKFELTSLSGAESVGITRLLMSIENPSPEVVNAVESAIAWFRASQLKGIRVDIRPDPASPKGTDRVVVEDPATEPIWARFYDIQTNRPIFADRDGIAREKLSDIGYERRNGYSWLNYWPKSLLAKDYPAWSAKLAKEKQ